MQAHNNLSFYHDLLVHYYHFTLENGVYAACLGLSVWLLTSALYSISISGLNRRNRINLKASLDAQNDLLVAQQQIQALQEEIEVSKQALEQESQRANALQERLTEIGSQLAESIVALAAEPDLGQQGLSVKEGLQAEQLWQRYSIAVKQIGESLIAEKKTASELKQACSAETAKVGEKDLQLQVAQIRADGQKQQLAKLELLVDEHKALLAQQQESAKLRLAEVEAKYQADLARLAAQPSSRQPLPKLQESPKVEVDTIKQAEPIKPVETKPAEQKVAAKPEPQEVKVESKPEQVYAVTAEPAAIIAEQPKQQTAKSPGISVGALSGKFKNLIGSSKKPPVEKQPSAEVEKPSVVQQVKPVQKTVESSPAGKSKSLFAGFREKIDKLDRMMGQVTPQPQEEEEELPARFYAQPQAAQAETASVRSEAPVREKQIDASVKNASAGLGGKFKNMFGSSKKSATAPIEVAKPIEPEPQPVEEIAEKKGKFNKLFGKFKK